MKPDKLNRPDGSGPDPCCFNRRGFWVKGIVACKLKMPIQLSSVKGPCKKAVLLGAGVVIIHGILINKKIKIG
ncbi:MAG: hypothetical protein ACUVTF_08295 [bacterium]